MTGSLQDLGGQGERLRTGVGARPLQDGAPLCFRPQPGPAPGQGARQHLASLPSSGQCLDQGRLVQY